MSNLEQSMKAVAAVLTGRSEDDIPEKLEEICEFIAKNCASVSRKAEAVEFTESGATVETCATAINALIEKLKAAGMMA